jgi:type IV pilus assembly protein PilQ
MKTFRRLAVLGLFAAIGVGLAICVGMSANSPPEGPPASVSEQPEAASLSKRAAAHVVSAMPVTILPPPAMLAEPNPPVAQQAPAPPPPGNGLLPSAMNFLRQQLAPPPAPAAGSPPQPAKAKTTVNGEGDGKLRIHIYDEDLRKVLDLLSEQGGLNILASKNVEGKVSATLNGVDIDSALQAILKSTGYVSRRDGDFIFVGTPEDFNNAEQAMDRVGTRVYRTNYVTAAELKALIAPLLTEKIGVVSVSTPAEAGIATNDSIAGGDKFSGNEVLVVRDYEAVLSQIDQMVAEVDVRPLQVSIEAMILSVQLADNDKFGVNFQLLRQNPNISFGLGSPPASVSAVDFPLNGGLKFGFLDTNLGAFINALESVGDTNVIANPRLMVLNKQRAEIQIGEKKGYINQTITQTASSQSVEFLDTGTQLRLRPFISSDGLIRMEVHPELSDGDVRLEGGFTLPNKTLTQVTTNIMVRDGCTVVIGGLIKEQLTNTTTQLPVLGNLPFVGFAFRQTEETTERREVIVLITPRIVYEPGSCQEGEKAGCEYLRRQSTYADKMSPFGKRSIGRRYLRLAEKAYAAGEQQKALWLAEMAVQFDPLSCPALDLRSDIWLGKPYEARSPDTGQSGMPQTDLMDGQTMPDWLADGLENAPAGPPMPVHPLDRGTPGSSHDIVRPRKLQ